MRKGIRGFAFALVLVAALCLAAPLSAQVNTGNIYGNVIDEQGMTIPGGTATLTGPRAPWACWVDAGELRRLRRLRQTPHGWWDPPLPTELTTPKPGPTK